MGSIWKNLKRTIDRRANRLFDVWNTLMDISIGYLLADYMLSETAASGWTNAGSGRGADPKGWISDTIPPRELRGLKKDMLDAMAPDGDIDDIPLVMLRLTNLLRKHMRPHGFIDVEGTIDRFDGFRKRTAGLIADDRLDDARTAADTFVQSLDRLLERKDYALDVGRQGLYRDLSARVDKAGGDMVDFLANARDNHGMPHEHGEDILKTVTAIVNRHARLLEAGFNGQPSEDGDYERLTDAAIEEIGNIRDLIQETLDEITESDPKPETDIVDNRDFRFVEERLDRLEDKIQRHASYISTLRANVVWPDDDDDTEEIINDLVMQLETADTDLQRMQVSDITDILRENPFSEPSLANAGFLDEKYMMAKYVSDSISDIMSAYRDLDSRDDKRELKFMEIDADMMEIRHLIKIRTPEELERHRKSLDAKKNYDPKASAIKELGN